MAKRKPRNCIVKTKDGNCGGRYNLTYESNAPLFTCDQCGNQDTTWKKFYNEYLQLYTQKENWDQEKHKVSCIIGFFCHMYRDKYNTDYIFVPKSRNPYSSKECKDAWRLLAAFGGDAHRVRKYIYWVFKKLLKSNSTITSLGYINTAGIIRKYNIYASRKNQITRATKLPNKFLEWCRTNTPEVFNQYEMNTVNDLGALLSYINHYGSGDSEAKTIEAAEKFNLIKNGRLNIKE